MLLGTNFDNIDLTTIQGLLDAGATESVHLEFKRETYGNSDNDKKEFLKDISSLANSLGGHLIIGINEENGVARELMPLSGIDVDSELLRLENIARTGLEPSIIGLRMKRVQVDDGDCIVIHVPHSYNPPHRVIFKNRNRYYSRNSSGAYELSLEELRALFGQQRSIEERARSFVNERFLRIQANDGALTLPSDRAVLVVHLVPLPDFGADRRLDVTTLGRQRAAFRPLGSSGDSFRINLDGFVVFRPGEVCHGYTQIFRNGSVEATSASVISNSNEGQYFAGGVQPRRIFEAVSSYMGGLQALETSTPVLLQLSFFRMNGVQLAVPQEYFDTPPPYEREELHLPSTIIANHRDDGNYQNVVAEQMNYLWNAFDFERCPYFDEEGNWTGR
jgi:signal peptidase I